jgi:hypothetical protein
MTCRAELVSELLDFSLVEAAADNVKVDLHPVLS